MHHSGAVVRWDAELELRTALDALDACNADVCEAQAAHGAVLDAANGGAWDGATDEEDEGKGDDAAVAAAKVVVAAARRSVASERCKRAVEALTFAFVADGSRDVALAAALEEGTPATSFSTPRLHALALSPSGF